MDKNIPTEDNTDQAAHSVHQTAPPMPDGSSNQNPASIGFWALVKEDLQCHDGKIGAQGFWALFNHRFGNWRMSVKFKPLRILLTIIYRIWYKNVQIFGGIDIPYTTKLGRRITLEHFGGMILVARSVGDDVTIRQNTTFGVRNTQDLNAKPVIGNHVDIGVGAVLVGAIEIGDHAVIGANAVVVKDVPAYATVGGIPAKILKQRKPNNVV